MALGLNGVIDLILRLNAKEDAIKLQTPIAHRMFRDLGNTYRPWRKTTEYPVRPVGYMLLASEGVNSFA